jgi:porphobilinogen synthase
MEFPEIRMRERRKDQATREKYRQTQRLSVKDLIIPIFVKEGISGKHEIKSMPGIFQYSLKEAIAQARKIYHAEIPAVILFGIPLHKDATGTSAYATEGIVQKAIAAIKNKVSGLEVIADVCMCEYTSHGHCGIIKNSSELRVHSSQKKQKNYELRTIDYGLIDNDATIEILARIAVSYAQAGVDTVAPSAMMDGQVQAIKKALIKNNYPKVKIMAYSAKYASGFYEPFRQAAESPPQFGDRKTYQMDYHNSDEAVLEAKLDIKEGADMVMVKPALGYEDIIYRIKRELKFPLACYSVSGEYSLIKAAVIKGYINERKIVLETLTGFKRAGADRIITYYALETAQWLKNKKKI